MFSVFFVLLFLAARGFADYKVVCYYGSWSSYRWNDGKFEIEDLEDPTLCTHLIYAFAGLNPSTNEIRILDPYIDLAENNGKNTYRRTIALKNKNPSLKVLLSVGGYNEGSYRFSVMATDAAKRRTFISSVVTLIGAFGFDGIDIDWEYPANRGGAHTDKEYFVVLLRELKEELDKHGWLLTIAVGMGYNTAVTAYNFAEVAAYTDFVNLMAYDFFGSYDRFTDHHARLYSDPLTTNIQKYYNLNESIHLWIEGGAPPKKLVVGHPFYGRTYTVPESIIGPIRTYASGAGYPGQYTQESGFIGYYEMCTKLQEGGWTINTDQYVLAPWAYKGNQWIAYDSVSSIILKSKWGKELGLGGAMVWSIETDDFRNLCGDGKFPLLTAMNSIWRPEIKPGTTVTPGTKTTPTTTTTTTRGPDATPRTETTSTTTTATTTTLGPDISVGPSCTVGTYKPDPEDCSKYYQCTTSSDGSSQWISQSCSNGLYFNIQIIACDYPDNVKCGETGTNPTSTTTTPTTTTTQEPDVTSGTKTTSTTTSTTTQNPVDSSTTKTTSTAATTTTQDPEPSPKTTTTTSTTTSTTTLNPDVSPETPCTVGAFKSDPQDCSKYYQCTASNDGSSQWISRSCSHGLYFNVKISACDYPTNVDCGKEETQTKTTITTTTLASIVSQEVHTTPKTTTTTTKVPDVSPEVETTSITTTSTSTTKGPGVSSEVETTSKTTTTTTGPPESCTVGTFKSDPENCSKYYQCTVSSDGSGEWISRSCASELYFNEQISACDHPQNVDCEN